MFPAVNPKAPAEQVRESQFKILLGQRGKDRACSNGVSTDSLRVDVPKVSGMDASIREKLRTHTSTLK